MYAITSPSSIAHVEVESMRKHFDIAEACVNLNCISDILLQEVLAHLRGEPVTISLVISFSRNVGAPILSKHYIEPNTVMLCCSDGDLVRPKEQLIRNFHTFDEYYACSSGPMEVPFPRAVLIGVLDRLSGADLSSVSSCLAWARPKNRLLFVEFDPDRVDKKVVDGFVDKLTEEDHYTLFQISTSCRDEPHSSYLPLTRYGYLLSLPGYSRNVKLLEQLIPEHPSYIAYMAQVGVSFSSYLPIPKRFLTVDYNDVKRSPRPPPSEGIKLIRSFIRMTPILTKQEVCILATMLGYKHPYFGNEKDTKCFPYAFPYTERNWLISYRTSIEAKMMEKIPLALLDSESYDEEAEL
jgi:hypothetical protein